MSDNVAPEIENNPLLKKIKIIQDFVENEISEIRNTYCKSENDLHLFIADVPEKNTQTIGFSIELDVIERANPH